MEQTAPPDRIRLTSSTAGLAAGSMEVEALGPVPVAGFTEPVPVFELLAAALCAADGAVVLGAPIGGADDEGSAEPVAQRLQLVGCGLVDEELAGAAAGDLNLECCRPREKIVARL